MNKDKGHQEESTCINLHIFQDLENDNVKVDTMTFQKMLLVFNSVEEGWTVKKRDHAYVFSKPHENKKEVLEDDYLAKFMKTNLDYNKIIQPS